MRDNTRVPLRILHTSDLHLASPDDSGCHSLKAVVDLAGKTNVGMVIIAGDLFDYFTVDDSLVSFVVEQLQGLSVNVAILPGNHDCLAPGSVFERTSLWHSADNIRVFRTLQGETFTFPELGVSVWGKPLTFNQGFETRPLDGAPRHKGNSQWHIAVVHGYYIHPEPSPFMDSVITRKEVVTSGWDYIALGHLVDFHCVCDEPMKAYYSGSPSLSGTVAFVDFADDTGVQVTPYSL